MSSVKLTQVNFFHHSNVCSLYRRDQDVCKTILNHVLPVVTNLGQGSSDTETTRDAQGQFLTVIGAFWWVQAVLFSIWFSSISLYKCVLCISALMQK